MKPSSAKAKGRRLQDYMVERLYKFFPHWREGDARGAIMGESGTDVPLSPAARDDFPYAMEMKNTERLNIWSAIVQAEAHARDSGLTPMVVFKRNRSEVWAAVPLDSFLNIAAVNPPTMYRKGD